MVVWATSNNVLRDAGQPVARSKVASVPISVTSLRPNTVYSFLVNGINMNWACKPFGGTLGSNISSDSTGTVNFQFLHDQRHMQGLMGTGVVSNTIVTQLKAQLVDGANNSTFFYIPVHMKPTQ